MILEEAARHEVVRNEADRPLHLLALGAKNEPALRQLAQRYEAYLAAHADADLGDVCFTANTGRFHGDHRLAVTGETTGQMRASLQSFIANQDDSNVVSGKVQKRRTKEGETAIGVELCPEHPDWPSLLKNLAQLYVSGALIDWAGFDRNYRRYPLVLPTYPFQRQRHWVD